MDDGSIGIQFRQIETTIKKFISSQLKAFLQNIPIL